MFLLLFFYSSFAHLCVIFFFFFLWCIFFSIFASHRSGNFVDIPITVSVRKERENEW